MCSGYPYAYGLGLGPPISAFRNRAKRGLIKKGPPLIGEVGTPDAPVTVTSSGGLRLSLMSSMTLPKLLSSLGITVCRQHKSELRSSADNGTFPPKNAVPP